MTARRRVRLRICALAAVLALGGCNSVLVETSNTDRLTALDYQAADKLIQQSRSLITPQTAIQPGSLNDIDSPGEVTSFGRIVAEQAAARFVQLGFTVQTGNGGAQAITPAAGGGPMVYQDTAYGSGPAGAAARPAAASSGSVTIGGQYVRAGHLVMVTLRLTDTQTGHIIAACDYTVPMTGDVKELTRTRAEKDSSWFDWLDF